MNIDELTLGDIKKIKSMYGVGESKPSSSLDNTVQIVILQRGWVVVGRYFKDGDHGRIENGHVIRLWGTSNGLGELAESGPTSFTKLDKSKSIRFHELTVVAMMDCEQSKWEQKCPKA
jgi:hypothetical protein